MPSNEILGGRLQRSMEIWPVELPLLTHDPPYAPPQELNAANRDRVAHLCKGRNGARQREQPGSAAFAQPRAAIEGELYSEYVDSQGLTHLLLDLLAVIWWRCVAVFMRDDPEHVRISCGNERGNCGLK